MGAFVPAPGIEQQYLGKAAGPQSQPCREAMRQMAEVEISTSCSHLALIEKKHESQRAPHRMFKAGAHQHQIGSAEPVILITRQELITVDVGSSKRRLKIERNEVSGRCDRFGNEETQAYGALPVS